MQIAREDKKDLCVKNSPISPSLKFGAAEMRAVAGMEIISSVQPGIGKSIGSLGIGVENEIQVQMIKP